MDGSMFIWQRKRLSRAGGYSLCSYDWDDHRIFRGCNRDLVFLMVVQINWYLLGYKNLEVSWVQLFWICFLINAGLLVIFKLIFDQGCVLGCANFCDLVFFKVVFWNFRRSFLFFLPQSTLPGSRRFYTSDTDGEDDKSGTGYFEIKAVATV